MWKRMREYFIGQYLREEADVLKRASLRLVYNIVSICIVCLVLLMFVYAGKGLHYQLLKNVFIVLFFTGALFYIKFRKSIEGVSQILLFVSWLNILGNIYLFEDFNFFMAFNTVINILFAFHTIGSRAGLGWSLAHFIPVCAHFILKIEGIRIRQLPPHQMADSELLITLFLLFFLTIYLLYHYHQAYVAARENIRKSVDEMKKAKELAEEMNRLKTNFLANMSHEIRTPINGILGISQVIEMEATDPEIKKYISLQKQSGKRLLDTITSILNLSRLESEKEQLELKVVDVNHLLHESMRPLEEMATAKNLTFHVDLYQGQLFCLADDTMLYQVFNNIIGNAIKFTDKGSIQITTKPKKDRPNYFVLRVEDTGIGISEEFIPKIFNPFEQESTGRGRSHEGSGLGLSISKKYIELLGGEIVVTSEKGKGSKFEIVMPLYKAS